jgi:hypothetical protein
MLYAINELAGFLADSVLSIHFAITDCWQVLIGPREGGPGIGEEVPVFWIYNRLVGIGRHL